MIKQGRQSRHVVTMFNHLQPPESIQVTTCHNHSSPSSSAVCCTYLYLLFGFIWCNLCHYSMNMPLFPPDLTICLAILGIGRLPWQARGTASIKLLQKKNWPVAYPVAILDGGFFGLNIHVPSGNQTLMTITIVENHLRMVDLSMFVYHMV